MNTEKIVNAEIKTKTGVDAVDAPGRVFTFNKNVNFTDNAWIHFINRALLWLLYWPKRDIVWSHRRHKADENPHDLAFRARRNFLGLYF